MSTAPDSSTAYLALIDTFSQTPIKKKEFLSSLIQNSLNPKSFGALCTLFKSFPQEEQEMCNFSQVFPYLRKSLNAKTYTGAEVVALFQEYPFIQPSVKDHLRLSKFLQEKKPAGYQDILTSLQGQTGNNSTTLGVIHKVISQVRQHKPIDSDTLTQLQAEYKTVMAPVVKSSKKTLTSDAVNSLFSKQDYQFQMKMLLQELIFNPHSQCTDILNPLELSIMSLFLVLEKQKFKTAQEFFPNFIQKYDFSAYFTPEVFSKTPAVAESYLNFSSLFRHDNIAFANAHKNLKHMKIEDDNVYWYVDHSGFFLDKPSSWTSRNKKHHLLDMGAMLIALRYAFNWDIPTIQEYFSVVDPLIKKHFSKQDPENKNPNLSGLSCYLNDGLAEFPKNDDNKKILEFIKIEFEKHLLNKTLTLKDETTPVKKFKI